MALQIKNFRLKLADAGGVQLQPGEFIGHASVFGNVDLGGDRVKRGAFARTIKAHSGRVPLLWQHTVEEPIGMSLSLEEDSEGLKVHGQLNLEVQRGRECNALLKQGAIGGLSFGYDVIRSSPGKGGSYRELEELKLYEISPVTFAMNPDAAVERVKSALLPGANKYVDFATCDSRAELYQARYRMESSLVTSVYSIMEEERPADERLALVEESLEQYSTAMLAWCSRFMEAMGKDAASKGTDGAAELKGLLSPENRARIESALRDVLHFMDSGSAHSAKASDTAPANPPSADDGAGLKQLVDEMKRDVEERRTKLAR